jgi:hypothetical protein
MWRRIALSHHGSRFGSHMRPMHLGQIFSSIKSFGVDSVCYMKKLSLGKFVATGLFFMALNNYRLSPVQAQVNDDAQPQAPAESAMTTVGAVEEVILTPWGATFAARIDTGADLSSLDARDLVVRNNVADFKLGRRWGSRRIQLPVVEWRRIQTASGTERRPVVEISICLGSKLFRTLATLKDRSEMLYPFLVGRTALSGKFLVDASRSKAVEPTCPAAALASSQSLSQPKE